MNDVRPEIPQRLAERRSCPGIRTLQEGPEGGGCAEGPIVDRSVACFAAGGRGEDARLMTAGTQSVAQPKKLNLCTAVQTSVVAEQENSHRS